MYNLNVNLAETAANAVNNLLVETNGPTPRTPEILNSLIAMTNPLDTLYAECKHGPPTNVSTDSNSSCSSSQLESPTTNPPSVQHTCSQLIKAGLKLTIEHKRKLNHDGDDFIDLDQCKRSRKIECSESEEDKIKIENGLTPEDEERRRRRRERNKIAATKCRLKKRERTANLITESETLESQNIELKNQLQELQQQKQSLEDLLAQHRPVCQNQVKQATRESLHRLPPVSSVIENHSYPYRGNPIEYRTTNNTLISFNKYMKNNNHYVSPPYVIIEDVDNNPIHITNLDNQHNAEHDYFNQLNHQCHNYSQNPSYSNNPGIGSGCLA